METAQTTRYGNRTDNAVWKPHTQRGMETAHTARYGNRDYDFVEEVKNGKNISHAMGA
jgi:hypothetical protein